jgi:hypothetical protein
VKILPLFMLSYLTIFILLGYQQSEVEASASPLNKGRVLKSSDPKIALYGGAYELWTMGVTPNSQIYYALSLTPENSNIALTSNQKSCDSEAIKNNINQIVENTTALDNIIACGSAAVPFILDSLPRQTKNTEIREQDILLLSALSVTGSQSDDAESALTKILINNSMIRRLTNRSDLNDLEDLLLETFKAVVRTSTLQEIVQHPRVIGEFRYWAAEQLLQRGQRDIAVSSLISILGNTTYSKSLRNLAALELGRLGQIEAVPTLRDILRSDSFSSCNDAFFLLQKIEFDPTLTNPCSSIQPLLTTRLRSKAIKRLQSSRPAICRFAVFQAFGTCR